MATLDTHPHPTTIGTQPMSRPRRTLTILAIVSLFAAAVGTTLLIRSTDDGGAGPVSGADPTGVVAEDLVDARTFAQRNGLTGLSPASMAPPGQAAVGTDSALVVPESARDMAAIAEFAREHGLAGGSPASLRPIGD